VLWGFCANHAIGVRHTLDVYWFVTMEDGLFFSYLLSHPAFDGIGDREDEMTHLC